MIERDLDKNDQEQEERRTHDRSRLIVDVFFDGQDATGIASTKDISVGGLYLNTQATLPRGTILAVRIPLSHDDPLVARAEVIYTEPGKGVGLAFRDLTEADREKIESEIGKR